MCASKFVFVMLYSGLNTTCAHVLMLWLYVCYVWNIDVDCWPCVSILITYVVQRLMTRRTSKRSWQAQAIPDASWQGGPPRGHWKRHSKRTSKRSNKTQSYLVLFFLDLGSRRYFSTASSTLGSEWQSCLLTTCCQHENYAGNVSLQCVHCHNRDLSICL